MNHPTPDSLPQPNIDDVRAAAKHLLPHAHHTPVLRCHSIDKKLGVNLFFKCENVQKAGAFKFRGAINAISHLSAEELKRGVVTHSSGNHAGGLAAAARIFGTAAHIVMPKNSSRIKMAAVEGYGGQITTCEPTLASRIEVANEIQSQTGAIMVPPFDHPHIIAGQGTSALELIEQVPDLDTIITPIGGGGLMSGTCIVIRALKPEMLILGAEPTGADDAFRSKQIGQMQPQLDPQTIADGLRTSLGQWTWPIIRDHVDEIITADDAQTVEAMRLFWERTKSIIEPSSAVPLAALTKWLPTSRRSKNIGVILTGGNVDLSALPW